MRRDVAMPHVEFVPPDDDPAVIDVLAEAFADYPVLRSVIGDAGGEEYAERLALLLGFFVAARRARGEPVLGVREGHGWLGAALATLPDAAAPAGSLDAVRARTWARLGAAARARYEEIGARWASLAVAEPRVHLNMVGVRSAARGRGIGVALVGSVVGLARAHATARGVSLSTETDANVAFYRRLGFVVRGEVEVAAGVRSWVMFRPA